jgi:hypothetical protein
VNGFGNPVWNWFTDTFQINNEIKIKTDAVAIKEQRLETAIELFLQQKPATNILLNIQGNYSYRINVRKI